MDMLTESLAVEKPQGPIVPKTQPIGDLLGLDKTVELDERAVREASIRAEANNQDPLTTTMADYAAAQGPVVQEKPAELPPAMPMSEIEAARIEVPEKFKKPDGEVDVDKLRTSTKQLDEAVKAKEAELSKTVDDYMSEYTTLEKKFRNMPNPKKLAQERPSVQEQVPPAHMTDQQLQEMIRRDYQADPLATMTNLMEIAISKRLEPYEQERKEGAIKSNISQLAKEDPRVLNPKVFDAINAELVRNPGYNALPNPHRAAWLEVKDRLRLGEPFQAPAQPSRPSAPVLAGGTPPSAPSSSVPNQNDILSNLDKIDLTNKKNEAMADEAIRAFLSRNSR